MERENVRTRSGMETLPLYFSATSRVKHMEREPDKPSARRDGLLSGDPDTLIKAVNGQP
jgi:hypothetical protein